MTTRFLIAFIFLITANQALFAQGDGQILRGSIKDQISHQPIPFANVILSDSLISSTDENGDFRFEGLAFGAYNLAVSYIGYEDIYLRNLIVDSGKESVYNLFMEESAEQLEDVVITASKDRIKPLNEMSLLSTRMVGVEETKKYASAFNDPARMANSFAGVVQTDAGSNNIAIRGNAPNGLLWRLEGVEIPNPNHFSSVGTAGGGVSILSSQLLANSDFSTGAFAAEYGNALSGVFDIKLRKGNDEKREYTFQAGILGIDLAAEGPFSKNGNNSYLVNYRYSTLGILSKSIDLGGFITTFQDLSYNLSFKNKKLGDFTFFGLNGLSSQTGHDSIFQYDLDFEANTLVNGMTHSKTIGKNSFLKSAVVLSKTENKIKASELDELSEDKYVSYDESHENSRLILSSKLQHKLNPRSSLKIGAIHSLLWYDTFKSSRDSIHLPDELFYQQDGSTSVSQFYAQLLNKSSKRFVTTIGVHFIHNWLNEQSSLEPRLGLQYALRPNQSLSLGYGLHSQVVPLGTYFVEAEGESGPNLPNINLPMSKAHHGVIGYSYKASQFLNFKIEGYYQALFDIPQGVVAEENESLLNVDQGTLDEELTPDGIGRNYGAELTIERFLNKGFYLTFAGSIYDSKFRGTDGQWYNTRFNGGFATSLTSGKEFTISKRKNRSMGIHIKTIYTGGLRQTPIDVEESLLRGETVYELGNPFSEQLPNFFRFDLKISFKRNYKNITTSLVFDIQNVSNRENAAFDEYNPSKNRVERFTQVGLLPIISYKIEF
ncbi:MAG: TonB-dependent receptor [Bacteroidota bacterium]